MDFSRWPVLSLTGHWLRSLPLPTRLVAPSFSQAQPHPVPGPLDRGLFLTDQSESAISLLRITQVQPVAHRIRCKVLRKHHTFLLWVVGLPGLPPPAMLADLTLPQPSCCLSPPGFPCLHPSVLCPDNVNALDKLDRREDFIQEDCSKGERLGPLP